MREKIAKILYACDWDMGPITSEFAFDGLGHESREEYYMYADQILSLILAEIKGVENPYNKKDYTEKPRAINGNCAHTLFNEGKQAIIQRIKGE